MFILGGLSRYSFILQVFGIFGTGKASNYLNSVDRRITWFSLKAKGTGFDFQFKHQHLIPGIVI